MYCCQAAHNARVDCYREIKLTVDAVVIVIGVAALCALCILMMRMMVACVDMKMNGDRIIVLRSMCDTHRVAVYFDGSDDQERHCK